MSLADDVYMANSHSIVKNCKIYAASTESSFDSRWGGRHEQSAIFPQYDKRLLGIKSYCLPRARSYGEAEPSVVL